MTFRNTLAILLTSVALTMGFTGCGDDKEDNTNQPTTQDPITDPKPDDPSVEPCKGDECSAKQQDAENKMASCDFAQAYEDINAIYAAQVKDNKLDPQTALDRSILGLIHILYREDVQAILPKLGFIAKSGLVDFKPLWQADNGIFKQVFTGNHNYDGYGDLIPMAIAKDDDKAWEDTIDKSLTFDNVLDVLVNLKPELESLASSLEEAAKLTGATPLSPNAKIGCGLNNFKMDAADLNTFAALLMAADAAIDLLAHYDFDFNIYESLNPPEEESVVNINYCRVFIDDNDEIVKDECKNYYNIDYHDWDCSEHEGWDEYNTILLCNEPVEIIPFIESCTVELNNSGKPTNDKCKEDHAADYSTLFCVKQDEDDDSYLECALPGKSDEYKEYEKYANLLIPHLFKPSQSKRTVAGSKGSTAFQKAAALFLEALNSSAKGAFFDFSKIPSGARQDMIDIAKQMADGTGDLSKFIKPGLIVDLKKVFDDVLHPNDGDMNLDVTGGETELYGKYWLGNFVTGIYGDELFLNETLPNYIFNTNLISHEISYGEGLDYIEIDFSIDSKFDASFSSDWDDLNLASWLNPHDYLGNSCTEGDECPEKCPDPDMPFYYKDSNNPNGFVCTPCWEKCEGNTPYCVKNIIINQYYCIDKPECPKGEQPYSDYIPDFETGDYTLFSSCIPMDGTPGLDFCLNEMGEYPNGRYINYDEKTDTYTCRPCEEKCGSDKPYCVSENPDDEYSRYFCAATESCPDGYHFAINGQCLPKSGSPCPDELKTKDICITEKNEGEDEFNSSDSALYFCNTDGLVEIQTAYNTECKEVDVSTYGTALKTIFVLVDQHSDAPQFPECGKSGVSTECIYTSDNKDAISGYACTKATDGTLVTIDLTERGIYLKTCSENQYCGYSEDIEMHTCFDLEADPEVPEP